MEIEHEYTEEITCPHCGKELGDSWEYQDSENHECYECKGKFRHDRDIDVTYVTSKI